MLAEIEVRVVDDNQYKKILDNLYDSLCFYGYIIDDVGDVLAIKMDKEDKDFDKAVHHDYVYFCITKSVRSLLASLELSKMRFREDSMIILRTVYECYLLLANAISDCQFIQKTVYNELGLKYGIYKYFKSRMGKTAFRKVVRYEDNKVFDHDLRKSTLSRSTYNTIDSKVHRYLYNYLCEHTHSHFISAGNYRTQDETKYDPNVQGAYIDVLFMINYLTYLIGESIYLYHKNYNYHITLTVVEIIELGEHLKKLKNDFNLIF